MEEHNNFDEENEAPWTPRDIQSRGWMLEFLRLSFLSLCFTFQGHLFGG